MNTRLKHPFTCIVAGPTGCGKMFITLLLQHASSFIDPPPEKVVWCYGELQHLYSTIPEVRFVDGLTDESLFNSKTKNLVIVDDLMTETDGRVTNLFTKKGHHCNTSVVHLVQSMFRKTRTVALSV